MPERRHFPLRSCHAADTLQLRVLSLLSILCGMLLHHIVPGIQQEMLCGILPTALKHQCIEKHHGKELEHRNETSSSPHHGLSHRCDDSDHSRRHKGNGGWVGDGPLRMTP